jgi:hypothetical protein
LPSACSTESRSDTTEATCASTTASPPVWRSGAPRGQRLARDLAQVEALRPELAAAVARDLEDRADEPVHLAGGGADEGQRLGQVLGRGRARLVDGGFGERVAVGEDVGLDGLERLLELAREAHDVDQGRAQVVGDDVGEALHLGVGAHQVLGALLDPLLEARVEAPQLAVGRAQHVHLAAQRVEGPAHRPRRASAASRLATWARRFRRS